MPIDIAALALNIVTSFLLPYVKDGAQKVAEAVTAKASKAAGEYTTEVTKKVWDRVKAVFSSDEDKVTLSQFEKRPEKAAPLVEDVLKEKLEKDPELAQELEQLVNVPGPGGKTASVQIRDVVGDVGVLYMPGADFRKAQHVTISGVSKSDPGGTPRVDRTDK